jgi:hypothetical protein
MKIVKSQRSSVLSKAAFATNVLATEPHDEAREASSPEVS